MSRFTEAVSVRGTELRPPNAGAAPAVRPARSRPGGAARRPACPECRAPLAAVAELLPSSINHWPAAHLHTARLSAPRPLLPARPTGPVTTRPDRRPLVRTPAADGPPQTSAADVSQTRRPRCVSVIGRSACPTQRRRTTYRQPDRTATHAGNTFNSVATLSPLARRGPADGRGRARRLATAGLLWCEPRAAGGPRAPAAAAAPVAVSGSRRVPCRGGISAAHRIPPAPPPAGRRTE